jgi:hypothetical protein
MVLAIQGVGLAGLLFMAFYTYLQLRRETISVRGAAAWLCIWVGLGLVISAPSLFYPVMETLRIPSTADFLFSVGLFVVLAGLFILHSRVTVLHKRLDELVEDDAVENPLRDAED